MRFYVMPLVLLLTPLTVGAQGHADVIRGHVRSDSGKAVPAATIIATRSPDRAVFQASADSLGAYVVVIPNGTGDYLVYYSALGRKPVRQRITRPSEAPLDTVFVVDAILSLTVQQLATVNVQAVKPKPSRNPDPGMRTGAAEQLVDDFLGAVPPELAGNIAALSSTIPGITPMNGGVSVLGLGPSQNSVTLNGMAFGSASLPRAARTSVRVSSTAYDPAVGWFGGVTSDVEMGAGSVYRLRSATATLDAPALQYTDALSARLGQRFTSANGSLGASGPLGNTDLYFYSFGVEASRRRSDAISLLHADADVLEHAGVSPDSVARLTRVLANVGLPAEYAPVPGAVGTDQLSFIARFDRNQLDARTFQPARQAGALTVFGNGSRSSPLMLGPTTLSTRAMQQWAGMAGAQGVFSTYLGNDYLATLRSALSYSGAHAEPYLALPSANVLVSSTLPRGDQGIASLAFGGGAPAFDTRRWTWENISETQLYAAGREAHRITLTADARFDGFLDETATGDPGTFSFNSLAHVEANQAASFSRALLAPQRNGGEWSAFAALGDLWRVSPNLRVQYGARVEGNVFSSRAPYNAAVTQAFGVRNDGAPDSWHASPRVGFTWVRRGGGNNGAIAFNKLGAYNMGPSSYMSGGIGEFRTLVSPTLLSDPSGMTGLPGSTRTVSCIGTAVPTPDWASYLGNSLAVPRACAGGVAGSALTDTAPTVRLVDRDFAAARSWRANLSYASQYRWLTYKVDGTYSLNLDQPGQVDLNLRNVPAFTVPGEGRAVFVAPAAIDPGSGAMTAAASRVTSAFARVLDTRADNRSVSRQVILTLAPDLYGSSDYWMSVSYVLASTRALQSGFDGSTFDSPFGRSWDRGAFDARHSFVLRGGYAVPGVTLTAFARVMSGLPFTPMVGGDVNGDGLSNDRAFIVDPSGTGSALARSMNTLIASSSTGVGDCLLRQRNAPAARNSCEGPWTTALNAQATIEGSHFHLGSRLRAVHINLSNPLGGFDQLLHGSAGLRGWGTQPAPDPVLYYVRGFDPVAQRFQYEVNPRFGATDLARTLVRAPFRATIDFSFNLTPDIAQQQLERYLGPGRAGRPGPRLGVAELMRRYERNVTNPYQAILREADSLLLSRGQVEALQQADGGYRQRMDSLWRAVAAEFAGFGDQYNVAAAVKRQEDAIGDARELTRLHMRATLGDILTPIQLLLMPGARLYRAEAPVVPSGRTLSP